MITNTIRFKASVLYTGILGIILMVFSVYVYHVTGQILKQSIDDELIVKADQVASMINAYGDVYKGRFPPMSLMDQFLNDDAPSLERGAFNKLWEKNRWLLSIKNNVFQVVDLEGKIVMQSDNFPEGAARAFGQASFAEGRTINYNDFRFGGVAFREIDFPFTFLVKRPLILQMAVSLAPADRVLSRLRVLMAVGVAGVLVLSIFVGAFLTGRILRPVSRVTRTANDISQRNLGVRISGEDLDQEMRLLVDSFNHMIDRLEKSFSHINEFSSHVAHELKTPLAIIKGELELALLRDDIPDEERRVMTVALQEIDRLVRIIRDLLLLAKFEYKLNVFNMEAMDLSLFLKEFHQQAQVLSEEKKISLELLLPEGGLWVRGDPVHLKRLFLNLVHNAIKFTPPGGAVRVRVAADGDRVLVAVEDSGPGIAAEDHGRIFEKFYRGRTRSIQESPGTGLGLCMARSIARAHGGDITFECPDGRGTIFITRLPRTLKTG